MNLQSISFFFPGAVLQGYPEHYLPNMEALLQDAFLLIVLDLSVGHLTI